MTDKPKAAPVEGMPEEPAGADLYKDGGGDVWVAKYIHDALRARAERLQAELDEWKRDRFKQFARAELERIWKEKAEAENALLKAAVRDADKQIAGYNAVWFRREHADAIAIAIARKP